MRMMLSLCCVLWVLVSCIDGIFFFFKQKTAYEMRISDWSSDVCSSDLPGHRGEQQVAPPRAAGGGEERRHHPFEEAMQARGEGAGSLGAVFEVAGDVRIPGAHVALRDGAFAGWIRGRGLIRTVVVVPLEELPRQPRRDDQRETGRAHV